MKRWAGAGLLCVLAAAAGAQDGDRLTRVYTNPALPAREALDRLNLRLAWQLQVPMDGRRDGFASIQLHDRYLLAQTRSGLVALLDAETGRTIWRTRAGLPYQPTLPLAVNYRAVYMVNGTFLYALDRETGAQLWVFRLPAGLSAPPVADNHFLYLSTVNTRLYCYRLPPSREEEALSGTGTSPGAAAAAPAPEPAAPYGASAPPTSAAPTPRAAPAPDPMRQSLGLNLLAVPTRAPGDEFAVGQQPVLRWDTVTRVPLELRPVFSTTSVVVASPTGTVFAMDKDPQNVAGPLELWRFNADGPIHVPPTAYEETAYVGSEDTNLYAINMPTGQLEWRFSGGTAVTREPRATADDVYVTTERLGLARVDRHSGDAVWRVPSRGRILPANPEADRFLAANPKFVYALDRSGRLLVLDRGRGAVLSVYDVRDYVFPVPNEVTDRVYLAANNGLIICLHDRDYAAPVRHRRAEERARNPIVAVREALERPVTEREGDLKNLRDLLRDLSQRYHVDIVLSERAFKEAGLDPIGDKTVRLPAVKETLFKDVLRQLLDQVNADYQVAGGIIFVVPGRPKPMK